MTYKPKPDSQCSGMELLTRAVHATMNDPSVPNEWGAERLKAHAGPRRVVWVRVDPSSIGAAEEAGGKLEGAQENGVRYNVTRIRGQVMDLHIYGEHERAAECILKNLVAAIDLTVNRVQFLSESWTSETVENDSHTRRPKVVVRAVFRLNVPDQVTPLQPLVGSEHECGLLPENGNAPLNSS